jgi:hypothetical protein
MSTLRHVILLNNEGVRLHLSGDLTGAIQAYQMGYFAIQAIAQPILQYQTVCCALTTATESMRSAMVESTTRIQLRTSAKLETMQPNLCFVNYRPLMLQFYDRDSIAILCFLRYNMGLASHELGIRSGCEQLLRCATESYDWTLLMLCNYTIDRDKHGILMCLALNNLAHLHYEKCDFRSSQSCIECMNYLITGMRCLEDLTVALFLTQRECDQIKLNVVHMKPPVAAGAA